MAINLCLLTHCISRQTTFGKKKKQNESELCSFTPIPYAFRFLVLLYTHFCSFNACRWCATCCDCNKINFSETSREDYNCRDSKGCDSGDQLYVRNCNDGHGAEFLLENYPDGYLLRVDDTDNCIERTQNSYLTLQRCDPTSERQKFQKFSQSEEFELRPVYDETDMCVSQHHHPKDYEVRHILS